MTSENITKDSGMTKEDLKEVLGAFEIGEILEIKPVDTSGNLAFVIQTTTNKYFIRFSPLGHRWRSREEVTAELELIHYLLDNGFPTPKPVSQKDGEEVVEWNNHYGYLREFTGGEEKTNPTTAEVEKFGELLGKLHKLTEGFKTKEERKHRWDLKTTKENFVGDVDLIRGGVFPWKEEFIQNFEKEIATLNFPDELPMGMIHEDLGKRHVVWRGEQIVAVIDFDRTYFGKLLLDLGQACRGWCFIDDWTAWSNENFESLVSGYIKHRDLSDLEKQYLVDAIKFGVLERGLSFCLRSSKTGDIDDAEYAMKSVSPDGFLKIIEENRGEINNILNKKTALT